MGRLLGAMLVATVLAGCADAREREDDRIPPVTNEGGPATSGVLGLNVTSTVGADEWEITIRGEMPAGSGWFLWWPFDGLQDGYSASHAVALDPCVGQAEGAWALWMRPQPVEAGEVWTMWFAADMAMHGAGTRSFGGAAGGATSADNLAGIMAALVLDEGACIEVRLSGGGSSRFGNQTPELRGAPSAFSEYVINEGAELEVIEHEVTLDGWTHVHRMPHCGTPLEDVPLVNLPEHLLYADIDFPNGYEARAGVYLNGLFPGPTPSEAAWFGTFDGATGPLLMDVKSPWPMECLVVVETAIPVPEFGASTGYIDQFSERVVPPSGTWSWTS